MAEIDSRKEYLKMERFLQTLVKEIALILETYNFTLVEWRKEEKGIKLIAEREGKKMELSFQFKE